MNFRENYVKKVEEFHILISTVKKVEEFHILISTGPFFLRNLSHTSHFPSIFKDFMNFRENYVKKVEEFHTSKVGREFDE